MKAWLREAVAEAKAKHDEEKKQVGFYGWTFHRAYRWFRQSRFAFDGHNENHFLTACRKAGLIRLRYYRD